MSKYLCAKKRGGGGSEKFATHHRTNACHVNHMGMSGAIESAATMLVWGCSTGHILSYIYSEWP